MIQPSTKPIVLDGRTGEGGGQLVRIACGLAALTSQPVTIENVRGNREGGRGGGLKAQHVTSLSWLAQVTGAETTGMAVGSKTLTFSPKRPPTDLAQRRFEIKADTDAASALLVLQAIFPYVLFAGNDAGEPVVLDIWGGTNVHWSLSYEYFDQVLAPTLEERFGIRMERALKARGWNLGPRSRGHMTLTIHPVPRGATLRFSPPREYAFPESYRVRRVDASVVVPGASHARVQEELVAALGPLYPDADVEFRVVEDSGSDARWSILLVAHSEGGIRWARDSLFSMPKKPKTSRDRVIQAACAGLCKALYEETSLGGTVDEFLQDQLLSVQALAEGYSSFVRGGDPAGSCTNGPVGEETRMRREKTHEPFGHGSTHTTTARWVISELLPEAEFYNKGDVVRGVGFSLQGS
ncbi:RNA 3'-phosphate cyclase domain protein [Metarhizium robertsii]|uniref:RNA 3'-terminal phosphate cyclase n=2 Tax=Metarhizium robertsii TaxID=568076 RepID=E9ELI6_METRA|nr:RNA 3'-terminal phosphate cyclase [Metarhizium robertsii ARSEF 23]EFZ03964.1 RNA 3'-terminal phosphate cyclase [Metarhizium robertsii ARSEF 23]EXU99060.1 RNA 3'-phosphate cyclase domain protein [Metarhizium robertsii]